MPPSFNMFAACQPGLEPLLASELGGLGAEPLVLPGGVAFVGDLRMAMRACLWLGTASHVSLRVAEFRCRALGELERKAVELPWRTWLKREVALEVRATSRASRVYHAGAITQRIENAIAMGFGTKPDSMDFATKPNATGLATKPPAVANADAAVARIHVRFMHDVCTISLDTMSTPLHRRGYRLEGAKAPLREDLAHALVLASGWACDEALLDPFCGSGTIAIEAAALARGLAPGRLRPAPLEHLALFDAKAWREAATETHPVHAPAISSSDRDEGAIAAARANAERAGVADAISFVHAAVTKNPWLEQPASAPKQGTLVTNPPFGRRISEAPKLDTLYQTLGHRAARLGASWRVAILAHDVRLARRTGLPLKVAFASKHGGLSVSAMTGAAATASSD